MRKSEIVKLVKALGNGGGCKSASVIVAVGLAFGASARSLLYYYDFDQVENGTLFYNGVNKGTGSGVFALKQSGTDALGYASDGAFGSPYAFSSTSKTSLWMGDGTTSLGCDTTRGFTISFWLKASTSHGKAWTDFFDFNIGGVDYRLEYMTDNTTKFTVYAKNTAVTGGEGRLTQGITSVPADTWTHVAFVFAPSTNKFGSNSIYIGGEKVRDLYLESSGDLQRLIVGSWVIGKDGKERNGNASNTGIDELAVFDYPATAEQVKWLGRFKPGQPAEGPGREMPFAWLFDSTNSTHGVLATNSGSSPLAASHWGYNSAYIALPSTNAALGSVYSMNTTNRTTWRVYSDTGLGATAGSGYTLSFWLKADDKLGAWNDFFTYCLGDTSRSTRFEWNDATVSEIRLFGALTRGDGYNTGFTHTPNEWNHICVVWNREDGKADFYSDGVRMTRASFASAPSDTTPLTEILVGGQSRENNGAWRYSFRDGGACFLDEFAMFNHSLSTGQVVWLGSHVPALPPLDVTNLTRTVTQDGAWFGHLASWGVREWDGSVWSAPTRSTIWPSCEDIDIEASVAFADDVTITNDAYVTCKTLSLSAMSGAPLPITVTLKSERDSRFAPQALDLGDGVHINVPLYAVSTEGALTLGTDTRITFDTSNFNDGGTSNALTAGSFVLPQGESDVLTHFAVTDNRFTLSLSADGKTILVAADAIPVTATWTGAGDGTSLDSAANWECRNGAGTVLAADTLPCANTVVIVSEGTAALNAPVGTVIPWPYLRLEAASATLATDTDWRGLDGVRLRDGAVINLNGHRFSINNIGGSGTITDTAETGGELCFEIPEGAVVTNATLQFTGTLRLVKDGAGEFVANVTGQSYAGGTEIRDGIFSYFAQGSSRVMGAAGSEICVSTNAAGQPTVLDMRGHTSLFDHTVVMRGGILIHTGTDIEVEDQQLGNVRLEADSWFGVTNSWGLCGKNKGKISVDLNGHTLAVHIERSKWFGIRNAEISNGVIDVTGGGGFRFAAAEGESNVGTNVDLRIASPIRVGGTLSLGGYEALYAWPYGYGGGVMNVYGTFKPSSHNYYYGCTMQDGSTIDLSTRTNALPCRSASTGGGLTALTFADSATVSVKVGGFRPASGEPVISWTAETCPANLDTITFKSADEDFRYGFIKRADGLYLTSGLIILLR